MLDMCLYQQNGYSPHLTDTPDKMGIIQVYINIVSCHNLQTVIELCKNIYPIKPNNWKDLYAMMFLMHPRISKGDSAR